MEGPSAQYFQDPRPWPHSLTGAIAEENHLLVGWKSRLYQPVVPVELLVTPWTDRLRPAVLKPTVPKTGNARGVESCICYYFAENVKKLNTLNFKNTILMKVSNYWNLAQFEDIGFRQLGRLAT